MVIGNGMVAQRFRDYTTGNRFVIFASGVSNSKTNDTAAYLREKELLQQTIDQYPNATLVYFSTCSVYDPDAQQTRYVQHKLQMEQLIRDNQASYYLFRVPNLAGRSDNPNTVLNFFVYHIQHKINFDLWVNSTRNLIDIDDMYTIADSILQQGIYPNQAINIANPVNYPVSEIVSAIEQHLGIMANAIPIQKGSHFGIDISLISHLVKDWTSRFTTDYLSNLLRKYYPR